MNDFSGTNVTVPSGATVYVPSPGITLVVELSSKVAGTVSSIGTRLLPSVKVGVPVCVWPCLSVEVAFSAVGVTGVTIGVYLAVTAVPFLSTRFTVTPSGVPTYVGSGLKVTVPSAATV